LLKEKVTPIMMELYMDKLYYEYIQIIRFNNPSCE
jgi:hypothetical protein